MSWNYEEIKKRRKALDKRSPFYRDDLENIKYMLTELGKEDFYSKFFSSLIFKTTPLTEIENNLSHYHSIAKFTNPVLLKAFTITKDYEMPEFQNPLPKKDFIIEEYIEMIHEFAQTLPEPFKKEVERYGHESYFQFSSIPNTKCRGFTFIIHSPNYKPYYLIKKTKNIEIFITMVHEIGHGIFMREDANLSPLHKLLSEVEGFFFDYLALEFLKSKKYFTEKEILIFDNFDNFSSSIYQYFVQALHLHLVYQARRFVSNEEILTESLKYQLPTPLSESYIELNSTADFFENTKYAFSYLVSLELQNIKDLEKALHYLYELRTNYTIDISQLLKKYSIFSLENNFASLKRVKEMHMKIDKHKKI